MFGKSYLLCRIIDATFILFLITVKKEKAEFVKKPENIEVTEEEDVRFETTVNAKPEPTVEW